MSAFEFQLESDFSLICFKNNDENLLTYHKELSTGIIQFHFNLKGSGLFKFQNNYSLSLNEEKALLLYNPQKELPINVEIQPKSWVISILVPIKKFHALFSEEAEVIPFLSPENLDRKYYGEESITPSMSIVLNQIFNYNQSSGLKSLYLKGKCYELLSLFFNKNEDPNAEHCPFLADEENVLKIKKAKEIIIINMSEPPSLQELADEVGISLKKLKQGFKEIYGDTVFNFLLDYKLEYARKLLDSGSYNVNEVGLKIGYSTSSHFIAAYKKKFGVTPKKYLLHSHISS